MSLPRLLRAFWFLVILAMSGIAFHYLWQNDFNPTPLLDKLQASNPWIFIACMIVLPLVGFPISVFYLFAGTVFPWSSALALCSVSLAVNQALAFGIARYCLADFLTDSLSRLGYPPASLSHKGALRLTFLIRTVPVVPYFIQNYLLALANVPFSLYWLISWLTQMVIAAGMTAIGGLLMSQRLVNVLVVCGIVVLLLILKLGIKYSGRTPAPGNNPAG